MASSFKSVAPLIALTLVLFLLFNLRGAFITPPKIESTHVFNAERAFQRLETILGDETPHPVDSDANDAVRERLLNEIRKLGFTPLVRDDFHCTVAFRTACARVQNVLFWVTEPGPNAVMVASHYDSVATGPGAADDGAGVAVSLEIAAIMKERNLKRPLLVLITDGEEAGLIGASSFVAKDPFAKDVAAVVSMEARGVSGRAALIETSRPNSRDIDILRGGNLPISSSLNTDVYEMMPNGTDVTVYLKLDIDAANLAFAARPALYHTPLDNLANLDKRTFFHMGKSALTAAETYLEQSGTKAEDQQIYADILGMFKIAMPVLAGLALMGLGGLAALAAFIKNRGTAPIRALLFPPLAIILGLALAIGLSLLAAMIRPEAQFGAAHPWALRAVQNFGALLGAVIALAFSYRVGSRQGHLWSAWLWFALLGLVLSIFVQGAAILFAPSLAFILVAAVLRLANQQGAATLVTIFAAILFAAMALPLTAAGELGLFIENSSPFAVAIIFLFTMIAPLLAPAEGFAKKARPSLIGAAGAALFAAFILTCFVPAYSPAAPQGLSFTHVAGETPGTAKWRVSARATLPGATKALATFSQGGIPGWPGRYALAPAPDIPNAGLNIDIIGDEREAGQRHVAIKISAPDIDMLYIPVKTDSGLDSINIAGEHMSVNRGLRCHGRSCRTLEMTLIFEADAPKPDLYLIGFRHGLGPESEALLQSRPDWAVPQHGGDMRAIIKRIKI